MYRIVASDMDETFLDGRHEIPPANLEALARMRELGVLFVPSSGRGYLSIMDNFADVDPAAWYGEAVRWAAGQGIVGGYGNSIYGRFAANRENLKAEF